MKSFRRSRSMYLRASSPTLVDDRDDSSANDLLIGTGTPSIRRCGTLFVESIHKLKCSSVSKGVALMSQSDVSIDRSDKYSNRDVHIPSVDPLTVYPSLNVYDGFTKNLVTFQCRTRRCEDDASDDALTAPRRYLSPSHLQTFNKTKMTQQYAWSQPVLESIAVLPHELVEQPVNTPPHLSDIPECVVIPRLSMNYGTTDPFPNAEGSSCGHNDLDSSFDGIRPKFEPIYYDDIPLSSGRKSECNFGWMTESNEKQIDLQGYSGIHQVENIPSSEVPAFDNALVVDSSINHKINKDDTDYEWTGKYDFTAEEVPPRNADYEFHENGNHNRNSCNNNRMHYCNDEKADCTCNNVNTSREFSFCSEGNSTAQRTYYLASPTEETTKVSSLSRKLQMNQRRRIVVPASDTSFETSKSGATQATSHSTSTGISRSSSRKTQELIRRFERHGLQKAGHSTTATTTMHNKGSIQQPT